MKNLENKKTEKQINRKKEIENENENEKLNGPGPIPDQGVRFLVSTNLVSV
jgi:hypothetical protein